MARRLLSRGGVRTLFVASLVVLTSACFQPVVDGGSDGGVDAGAGGGTGGGVATGGGGGALGGGAGGGGGGGLGGGGGGDVDAGFVLFGAVRPDCAPNDGAAWHFILSYAPVTCDALNNVEGYFIDLWTDPLVPGTTYELTPGGNRQGSACLCGFVGDSSVSGSVRIDTVSPTEVRGHIDAVFSTGAERHETFNVIVCPGQRMCG